MTTALFQEPTSVPEVQAPEDLDAPTVEAPYGWTTDPATGERRPKKTAGRRPKNAPAPEPQSTGTPPLEELKARAKAGPARTEDVAPAPAPAKHTFSIGKKNPKTPAEPVPPFRAGPIAKGVNKLYKRAGKIVKIWDPEVGGAIIACTLKDEGDEDDITVGEAWEELARTNPRVRAFLTKLITAGAFSSLVTAHLPILMAICLKEGIRSKIPILRLADVFLTDDDGQGGQFPSDLSQSLGGIGPADMAQMMQMAQAMMGSMADAMPRGMNDARDVQEAG